jgi:hypothetical protein
MTVNPRRKQRAEAVFLTPEQIEAQIHSHDEQVLDAIASSPSLTEDLALALLERRDLPQTALDNLAKNGPTMKSRKVKAALLKHQRTPRHVSLPLIRHLYTFELLQVSITPGVAADVKIATEEVLIGRMNTLAAGEKLSLAKRSSGRVVAALLNEKDKRIVAAGLDNPFLTENHIINALLQKNPSELLVADVCHHPKWALRKDVRAALLRNEFTPFAMAIAFAQSFSYAALKELMSQSQLPEKVKTYLLQIAEKKRP